jgi:predicted DNA-binding protein with PD1-like motif
MQYTEGSMGRIFYVRIDDGEDFLSTITDFVQEKNIRAGVIQFLGALSGGVMVTGPEQEVLPPQPHFEQFSGGWELFGYATITPGTTAPQIHFHGSAGRGKQAMTGCIRQNAKVYIIVEAVIMEITGLDIARQFDQHTGLTLPSPRP